MRLQTQTVRRAITLTVIAAAGLGVAAPAQASDASLRKAIRAQEKKFDVAAEDFAKASENVESAVGREQATTSLLKLKQATTRLRTTVAKERATTARVKRGRTQYLSAFASVLTGITTFQQGLVAFDPDAPAAAERLYRKSTAQLKAAALRRDRAVRLIGGIPV